MVTESITYFESLVKITRQGSLRADRAYKTAESSILLLVVWLSAPESTFSAPLYLKIARQPPGPGLPLQAPSVKISTVLILNTY